LDRQQLVQLARKTGADKKFQFDLGDIDEEQFTHVTRKAVAGSRVLRDDDAELRPPRRDAAPSALEVRP
jgi:hypothetical protein